MRRRRKNAEINVYLFSVLKPLIKSNPTIHESWGPGVLRWGSWQQCEDGEFVAAMWVRLEEHEKWEDMSAVNGIRLQCSDGKNLNSAEGVKGEWSQLFVYRVQNLFDWAFGPKKPYHNAMSVCTSGPCFLVPNIVVVMFLVFVLNVTMKVLMD